MMILLSGILNIECRMLNIEGASVCLRYSLFNIEYSTFNRGGTTR